MKNPLKYCFNNVRDSARQRKIPFTLTFEQFKKWADETGYLEKRGKGHEDLTIDRIDPGKPYEVGNIRALTWLENCSHAVEGMTDPREPIARSIAMYADGSKDQFYKYMKEATSVLEQTKILQRLEQERTKKELEEEDPF